MSDEIGIGTVLYLYDDRYRTRNTEVSPAERERACYRPHTITGETRGKWLLGGDDGGWYEANKKTLKMSGADRRYATPQFYTARQVEDRLWDVQHRRVLVRLVERADAATLREVAAAIGYHPDE